jgi:8-amino-7-oxononanoate synthase
VFSDRLNHASIIDGCRMSRAKIKIYDHCDVEHLDRLLDETRDVVRKLVVTESVFSMEGDLAPLPELIETAKKHGAMVMVDDAHALGVLGSSGGGALEHFGIGAERVDVVMGTMGKALGSSGAFVCGTEKLIDLLINRARTFIFTTGPAPSAAGAAMEALRLVKEEPWRRERVLKHAANVRAALAAKGIDVREGDAAIVPVIIGDPEKTMRAFEELLERGIFVQGIRPPTVPEGSSRLRINLSAAHSDEQVDKLEQALGDMLG